MKKTSSVIISICITLTAIIAVYVGKKKGIFDKLYMELPTIQMEAVTEDEEQSTDISKTEHEELLKRITSTIISSEDGVVVESIEDSTDKEKPYGGRDGVEINEEFDLKVIVLMPEKDYVTYRGKVKSCNITRKCDFKDYINFGLDDKQEYLDDNYNFISDFYYAIVQIEFTNIDDDILKELQTVWWAYCLNYDGSYYVDDRATSSSIGDKSDDPIHGGLKFEIGETRVMTLYFLLTDEEVENGTFSICFGEPIQTTYMGPWVILHHPEDGVDN